MLHSMVTPLVNPTPAFGTLALPLGWESYPRALPVTRVHDPSHLHSSSLCVSIFSPLGPPTLLVATLGDQQERVGAPVLQMKKLKIREF